MKQHLKNAQMFVMLQDLQPLLTQRNKIGYIAARNFRILSDALTEYNDFKMDLVRKYGEPKKDENGMEVGFALKVDSPNFKTFCDEMVPYNEIEHEVDLMIGKYADAIGCLSGEEILGVDWMLED